MQIAIKRVYEPAEPADGYRVLVDRLWPRGLSKESIAIDEWAKELAPSHELRKSFHTRRVDFAEFRKRYLEELKSGVETADQLRLRGGRKLTLLVASRDPEQNHAVVLREFLKP